MYGTKTNQITLPDAPEWTAKQCIVNLIENSAILKGKLASFTHYSGDLLDDADPDQLPKPFCRLHVKPGPSGWFAAGQHRFPVQFAWEMGVEGTDNRPLLALWHALRMSLSPGAIAPGDGTKTVLQVMMAAGLSTWEFLDATYEVVNPGKGQNRYIFGVGFQTGQLLINT